MESHCRMTYSPVAEEPNPFCTQVQMNKISINNFFLFPESSLMRIKCIYGLTNAPVIHCGIINPPLCLLNLALQVDSCLGGPAVGHSSIGFGLQVLQGCGHLFGQCSGLWGISFAPLRKKKAILSQTLFTLR